VEAVKARTIAARRNHPTTSTTRYAPHIPRSACLVESQPQPAHNNTLTSLKFTVAPGLKPCGRSTSRLQPPPHPPVV
jgi:hypothetical protein